MIPPHCNIACGNQTDVDQIIDLKYVQGNIIRHAVKRLQAMRHPGGHNAIPRGSP
jgi:hypothetical protein